MLRRTSERCESLLRHACPLTIDLKDGVWATGGLEQPVYSVPEDRLYVDEHAILDPTGTWVPHEHLHEHKLRKYDHVA